MGSAMFIEAGYQFSTKNQWVKIIRRLAKDFCIQEEVINKIIEETIIETKTKDQEVLYRKAQRRMLKLI